MMRSNNRIAASLLLLAAMLFVRCGEQLLAGGTSQTGNGVVLGAVVDSDGEPQRNVIVRLLPSTFDPVASGDVSPALRDTTDSNGTFCFSHVKPGDYRVGGVCLFSQTRSLSAVIRSADDTVRMVADTLLQPGRIAIRLKPGSYHVGGYCYIPGSFVYTLLGTDSLAVVLDSVPPGTRGPVMCVSPNGAAPPETLVISVLVSPGATTAIPNAGWNYSRVLTLNTLPAGAGIVETVTSFPLLLRLNSTNFDFSRARSDGGDIRFSSSSGVPLPYEIERWDTTAKTAVIWVLADTIRGNVGDQFIIMDWGNGSAASQSNGAAVFTTASGFEAVWHLGESASGSTKDASANHYDGVPANTSPTPVAGAIGQGRQFNGAVCFEVPQTASGSLNFPKNGVYTLSAWAWIETQNPQTRGILVKGEFQYRLVWELDNRWLMTEYLDNTGWEVTDWPSTAQTWAYITGVRNGDKEYLYVNGTCVNSTITISANTVSRDQSNNLVIGCSLDRGNTYYHDYFLGKIDEARVSRIAHSPAWIKLCYMNQKPVDALISF